MGSTKQSQPVAKLLLESGQNLESGYYTGVIWDSLIIGQHLGTKFFGELELGAVKHGKNDQFLVENS